MLLLQPATDEAYWRYLQESMYTAPVGLGVLVMEPLCTYLLNVPLDLGDGTKRKGGKTKRALSEPSVLVRGPLPSNAALFLLLVAAATYWVSLKMNRLILFLATPAAALTGLLVGFCWDMGMQPLVELAEKVDSVLAMAYDDTDEDGEEEDSSDSDGELKGRGEVLNKRRNKQETYLDEEGTLASSKAMVLLRVAITVLAMYLALPRIQSFYTSCYNEVQYGLSHPQIVKKVGQGELFDDYREAYWWLRDNTPADARILSWWDYGYQITAIANRTTLADGNTWNQEHIALLGLVLSSPPAEAHALARHLGDYVLGKWLLLRLVSAYPVPPTKLMTRLLRRACC